MWYIIYLPNAVVACHTNDDGEITRTAPLLRRFVGQDITALESWARKHGGRVEKMEGNPYI